MQPMPGLPTPFTAASMMAALAASMEAASCAASADLGAVLAMVSTAIALATSPGGVAAHAVAHAEQRRGGEIGVLVGLRTPATSERAPHMSMEDVPASKVASVSIRSSVMGSKSMVEPGSLSLASTAWRSISAVSSGETGAVGSGIDWMGILGLEARRRPGAACARAGARRQGGRRRGGGFDRDGGAGMRRGRMGGRHGGRLVVIGRPGSEAPDAGIAEARATGAARSGVLGL
ncbi:MAG: hypothetical protein ACLTSX_05055 [Collinsella sp.]